MDDEKLRELLALLESSRRWDTSSRAFLELERAVAPRKVGEEEAPPPAQPRLEG